MYALPFRTRKPCKNETSIQCCLKVGPLSVALARHWFCIGPTSRVSWGCVGWAGVKAHTYFMDHQVGEILEESSTYGDLVHLMNTDRPHFLNPDAHWLMLISFQHYFLQAESRDSQLEGKSALRGGCFYMDLMLYFVETETWITANISAKIQDKLSLYIVNTCKNRLAPHNLKVSAYISSPNWAGKNYYAVKCTKLALHSILMLRIAQTHKS